MFKQVFVYRKLGARDIKSFSTDMMLRVLGRSPTRKFQPKKFPSTKLSQKIPTWNIPTHIKHFVHKSGRCYMHIPIPGQKKIDISRMT